MDTSLQSALGISHNFEKNMPIPEGIKAQPHRFNPVTPDVSPPPPQGRMSQFTTPRNQQYFSDSTDFGDVSNVTSMDINEMESVRNHLQNMLKTSKDLNIDGDYERSVHKGSTTTDHVPGDGAANHSMSSVDTAAFLQKLLPNSSPLEELKVHFEFGDQSRETHTTDKMKTPRSDVQRQVAHHQQHPTSGANKSLVSENTLLRDHLDRERFRRKHCEQQIQDLHTKLLEIQQELAVAVSSERKKDVMIEQLDKTLAKVVEGWKRHEQEKLIMINTMKEEREVQEQSHQKQQEILLQFEKELAQAVEALTKEQERATEAEREKQLVIEKQKGEREQLLQVLSKEKNKVKQIDEEKMNIIKEKEQAQQKYMEAQKTINELSEKNSKLQSELTHLEDKFSNSLSEEKKRLQDERKVVKDSKDAISTMQKDIQRLEMDLDTTVREKESLKMEMSLMQTRYEASKAKEETERQAELERQVTQKLEDLQKQMTKSEKELRDNHKQQIQGVNNRHKEEMRQQLEKFHEEIKKKDIKLKTAATEYEERLTDAQDKIASLSNQRQQLENQRQNLTIRMHQMMQAHCDEALRLLTANKSPGKVDTKVESQFKPSFQEGTSKWLQQTPSPPSVFTNPMNRYPGTDDSNSYQHYTSTYNTQPIKDYSSSHNDPKMRQYPTDSGPVRHRVPSTNYHSNEETSTIINQQHTQHFLHSDPKHYSPTTASITAPHSPDYQVNKGPESVMFSGSYLVGGRGGDGGSEVTRSGLDFVPLKAVQDDHDTDSVISGLHESPGSGHGTYGSSTLQDIGYQQKVTSSGGSNGTLLEQDLDDSRMTVTSVSPDILQKNRHDISVKLQEQEQRQAELNHYVNMLLKRSPGHPVDEGLENLSSGLMDIPCSAQGLSDFSPFKTNDPDYGYSTQSHSIMVGSDSVTKDHSQQSQNPAQAFSKTTVPVAFGVKHLESQQHHQVPQYRHPISHPQTPPRRDRDPINQDTSQQPPLSPKQMKQFSKLLSLMAEGQPGVQIPSTEQLFGVLKEMQNRSMSSGIQPTVATDTSGTSTSTNTSKANISKVKRNLGTSYPSSGKPKTQGVPQSSHPNHPHVHTIPPKTNEHHKRRLPSIDGEPTQRLGTDPVAPRHQAHTKASSRQAVLPKVDKKTVPPPGAKQAKPFTAWR